MKLLKKLAALFAATTALALTSCDNLGFDANSFQNKVGSYFLEMTSSAAIALFEVTPDDTVKNKYGVDCVPATGDHVVSFTLRNPQKYHFTLHNNMECSVGGLIIGEAEGVSIAQDPDDTAKINITYSSTYLLNHPLGDDISPTVELFHPVSHASFGVFDKMKISSDSPPPSVQLACFQRDNNGTTTGTDYTSDDHYVICFYLPKISQFADSYHGSKTDVHTFYINGTKKYIKASDGTIWNSASVDETGNWTFTDQDTSISGSRPTTLEALNPGGFEFLGTGTGDEAEYDGLYEARYMTLSDKTIDEYGPDTITYNFTMEDDAGLSSSLATSNKASRLNAPLLQDPSGDPISDGTVVTADDETGFYTLRIVHDGKDEDGNACGAVNINYTIQRTGGTASFGDDATHTLRGSSAGSASIKLPGRCTFKIQATASKNYYITSLKTEATGVKVTQPAVFYVSQKGDDEGGTGARGTPFRTIQKALQVFASSGYDISDGCKIWVMSDLSRPDGYTFPTYDSSKNAFVVIGSDSGAAPVTIQGYGGTWTLDASGNSGTARSCIAITNGKLTLQNINVTGAQGETRHGSGYAGIIIKKSGDSFKYTNGRVYGIKKAPAVDVAVADAKPTFTNIKFDNNGNSSADDGYKCGCALNVGGNRSEVVLNNCDFIDNGAQGWAALGPSEGGAIYVSGDDSKLTINGGSIKGTKIPIGANGKAKGGAIYVYEGSLELNDVEISGSLGALEGGAIYVESGSTSLTNVKITGNKADKYGAIYTKGMLTLDSCTITGNHADSECAGVWTEGATIGLQIKGKNTIYDNCITGTTTQSNLTMPYGKRIDIYSSGDNSVYNSLIGVYVDLTTGHHEPTVGHPVVFTNGYGYSEGDDYPPKPGVVFKSENGYGIAPSGIEAAFAVSSASSYNATDYTFTPMLSEAEDQYAGMYPGATKTFTLNETFGSRKEPTGTPAYSALYLKTSDSSFYTTSGSTKIPDPTGAKATISAALYSGGTKVRDATVDPTDASKITLVAKTAGDAAILPPNNYTLKVIVEFLGAKHEANIPIAIDYSAETVADYIGGLTTAGDYSVKVVGTVGPRMDYASTTITTGDDGLAKVAKAIKRAASGVMIKLDARETNYVPADGDPDADDYNPLANYNNNSYFAGCANLKEMYLPDWLQYIVARQDVSDVIGLFEGCSGLTKVELSSNVKLVMYNAFKGCSSLARISLSEKISEASSSDDPRGIQAGAFVGCAEGFKIDFAGTKEQWKKVSRPYQATNRWHDGALEDTADAGSVYCLADNSWTGLDYPPIPEVCDLTEAPTSGIYALSTLDELKKIAAWTTVEPRSTLENVTFNLTADIDTQGQQVTIGYFAYGSPADTVHAFKGTFDGGGHKITNTIAETDGEALFSALFYCVNGGTVKNLTVAGTSNRSSLIGWMGEGLVENCVSETNITISSSDSFSRSKIHLGGIVSYADNKSSNPVVIKNCVNKGNIIVDKSDKLVGGIVGSFWSNSGKIDRCINKGNITITSDVTAIGGIGGDLASYISVSNCKNEGTITTPSSVYVGGIAGKLNNGSEATETSRMILNCCNIGVVNSEKSYSSGLFGRLNAKPNLRNNCVSGDSYYGFAANIQKTLEGYFRSADFIKNNFCMEASCRSGNLYDYGGAISIVDENVKSFTSSDAGNVVSSLNQWISDNSASYSSIEFATWEVKDGKPVLDLGELDNK